MMPAFTGVLKQNDTPISVSTSELFFIRDGTWIVAYFDMTPSATGTSGTEIKITPTGLPTPSPSGAGQSAGMFLHVGGSTRYHGNVTWDGTDLRFFVHNASTPLGQTPNFAIDNTHRLAGHLAFRAAPA